MSEYLHTEKPVLDQLACRSPAPHRGANARERVEVDDGFDGIDVDAAGGEARGQRIVVMGFCFGGYIVNMLAAVIPDALDAGVPFYGTPAAKEIRGNVRGPLLVQLAGLDKRINDSWPEYEQDLKAVGAEYAMHMYPGVNHGFHNDSTGRYDEAAAELAWKRTIEFFEERLAG